MSSKVGLAHGHDWFHEGIVVAWHLSLVQSTVLREVKLGIINVTPLVSNRRVDSVKHRETFAQWNHVWSQLNQELLECFSLES